MSNIYKEGAAIANGASAEIADYVSDKAGERFKKAFFETLTSFLHEADEGARAGVVTLVKAASDGTSLDHLKEIAKARGLA